MTDLTIPANAAPIQVTLMGYDWQIVDASGFIIGQYKKYRTAIDTLAQINDPNLTVRAAR